MDNFTPEQIEQFLEQFFNVVGRRQYIGARYVPIFGRKDESTIDWDNTKPYEPLTIVLYQGNSYTSRTYVPTGIAITDTTYWANTGNYNAQIEAYRQEVQRLSEQVSDFQDNIDEMSEQVSDIQDRVDEVAVIIPENEFDNSNTVKNYIDNKVADIRKNALDFINVKENGAVGDGFTDDWNAIQTCLTALHNNGGGVLYIPKGTYVVTKTLIVGNNTIITGDGISSVIYGKDDFSRLGTCIGVSGNNVIIEKIDGKYDTDVFNQPGSNVGFIGIGDYTFDSSISFLESFDTTDLVTTERYNVVCQDIITNCSYPLQAECTPNPQHLGDGIHDVIYNNIIAPNGVVSYQANSEMGVYDVYMSNIKCAMLRGNSGYITRAFINNCVANVGRFSSGPVYISNSAFVYDENSIVRDWISYGHITNVEAILYGNALHLQNVSVDGCGNDGGLRGIRVSGTLANNKTDQPTFSNVIVKGINSGEVIRCIVHTSHAVDAPLMVNCIFNDASNTTQAASVFIGLGNNVKVPAHVDNLNESYIFIDNIVRYGQIINPHSDLTFTPAQNGLFAYAQGKTLYFGGLIASTSNIASGTKLFDILDVDKNRAFSTRIGCVVFTDTFLCYPATIEISGAGAATLYSPYASQVRYIVVSGTYPMFAN